jgi:membrane protease YdiL (CAAX protease family)
MGFVLVFLIYNTMLAVRAVMRQQPLPRRLSTASLRSFGARQVLFLIVLYLGFSSNGLNAASVGIPAQIRWPETILAGEIGFLAALVVNLLLLLVLRQIGPMRLTAARVNLRIWPRGRVEKWFAALFIMVLNPFVEELVMRGVLVHQWGLILGSAVLPIAVGFALNGALHWYQGWRMQAWHATYFAVAVWLLYSPWGLPAAMAAHVLGDVLPILSLKRSLRAAHAGRRRSLRKAAVARANPV